MLLYATICAGIWYYDALLYARCYMLQHAATCAAICCYMLLHALLWVLLWGVLLWAALCCYVLLHSTLGAGEGSWGGEVLQCFTGNWSVSRETGVFHGKGLESVIR